MSFAMRSQLIEGHYKRYNPEGFDRAALTTETNHAVLVRLGRQIATMNMAFG
jgi:hypothetical protein